MARPRKRLPTGFQDLFLELAKTGLRESAAATALGVKLSEFRAILKHNEAAKSAWDDALSVERDALLGALHDKAMNGDTKAATTLLATRHGMSEKTAEAASERVNVVFNLPAAMSPAEYLKIVNAKPELTHDGSD